jgi:hypothetical protein
MSNSTSNANLILPLSRPNIWSLRKQPFFYLAGPVQGGGDWQYTMSEMLAAKRPCVIANPTEYRSYSTYYGTRLEGPRDFTTHQQWERHYSQHAAKSALCGALIFWLPKESLKCPRRDGRPYAMNTRGELGEWRGRLSHDPALRVIVGVHEHFPGADTIRAAFAHAVDGSFPIYSTMHDVAEAAYRIVDAVSRECVASARA